MNKDPINCIECGRFCCYETMTMVSFTPDNAFGPEESLFECIDCVEKRKTPKEKNKMLTKIVRLISGEELIAKVTSTENTDKLIIKTPMQLIPTGQQGQIAIVPWCMFGDPRDEIAINRDHIVYVVEPADEIRNEYAKHSNGLVVARSPGLLVE